MNKGEQGIRAIHDEQEFFSGYRQQEIRGYNPGCCCVEQFRLLWSAGGPVTERNLICYLS